MRDVETVYGCNIIPYYCRARFSDAFNTLARHLKRIDSTGRRRVESEQMHSALSNWAKSLRLPLQTTEIQAIITHYTAVGVDVAPPSWFVNRQNVDLHVLTCY